MEPAEYSPTVKPLQETGHAQTTQLFSEGILELKRWAEQMPVPREGNERDAGEQQQRRMNAGPPTKLRNLPESHRGDGERD